MTGPSVGIVIPTLNEVAYLPALLDDLAHLRIPKEILIADGGSEDETTTVAAQAGVRVLTTSRGRAVQMNAGAAACDAPWLCFLHADVRLPVAARAALETAVTQGRVDAAVWRLRIDGRGWWLRAVEWGARMRDRLGGLPYGDQGLLVRRDRFDAAGGFPPIPIMEDVALVRSLRRQTRVERFDAAIVVSARRWQREGGVRTWVRNAALLSAYLAGVSPERLVRWYQPEPR